MSAPVYTDRELADRLSISVQKLHELRKRHDWPHVRLGRFDFRFTEEHVAQILERHQAGGKRPESVATPAVTGQTARSASRRRSA